ncbi:MAG TPA: hypothetical protein VGR76_08390, partial [Candidatus Angelobacter sp.]|nr:hypothetical protein [Candidatus Angelobacter sp.]
MAALYPLMLEAALRALLAAAAVWAGLRLLRVSNVVVLKVAWALVLVASIALPLAPGWLSAGKAALRLPAMPAISISKHIAVHASDAPKAQSQVATARETDLANADAYSEHYSSPAISDEHFGSAATQTAGERIAEVDLAAAAAPAVKAPPSQLQASEVASETTMPLVSKKATDANRSSVRIAGFCLLLYFGVTSALLMRLL